MQECQFPLNIENAAAAKSCSQLHLLEVTSSPGSHVGFWWVVPAGQIPLPHVYINVHTHFYMSAGSLLHVFVVITGCNSLVGCDVLAQQARP